MNKEELLILHDHYKESFSYLLKDKRSRDILMIQVLAVITFQLFQMYSPENYGETLTHLITSRIGLVGSIDISFIGSILWFILLALVLKYFQIVIHIDRQYNYIHTLEKQLSKEYKNDAFTREGKSYLSQYKLFSNWTSFIYTAIFPTILLITLTGKITNEFSKNSDISFLTFFNLTIFLSIFITTILYLISFHLKK